MRTIGMVIAMLCMSVSVSAHSTDSVLMDAYQREDMRVWQAYIDRLCMTEYRPATPDRVQTDLLIEYGLCGYMVGEAKSEEQRAKIEEAKRYVQQIKNHVEAQKESLPVGHYEMYLSAVYVFELRLHESIHPIKAMNLAQKATQLAPSDPLVLSYYGTCLFYAPKPFGSKAEALRWFEKAQSGFADDAYRFCWIREANEMYIRQCHEKLR